jgi:hypothetical protein
MGKTRIHLSLSDSILAKLDTIAQARDFADRVALFEQLVREEWERRHGPATILRDAPITPEQAAAAAIHHSAVAAGKPVSYGTNAKAKGKGKGNAPGSAQSPQS